MKKSILQFSVIAAIAASMTLTTSCSSDESVAEAYVPEAVKFGIDLGDMTVARANTRTQEAGTAKNWASIDGVFALNDIVHIWTTDADGKIYRKAYKVQTAATAAQGDNALTAAYTTGTGATDQFYWSGTEERKLYVIYSFGNAAADSTNIKDSQRTFDAPAPDPLEGIPGKYLFEVSDDQSEETANKEFLFGYGTIYYGTTAKQLKVSHQLSRIDVNVVTNKNNVKVTKKVGFNPDSDTEWTGTDVKEAQTSQPLSLTIGSSTTQRKGMFTPKSFTPSVVSPSTDDEIKGDKTDVGTWSTEVSDVGAQVTGPITPRVLIEQRYNESTKKFETNYSAVIIPQNVAAGADWFTISYDGATYKYKIPAGGVTFEPGKKYVYKVEFADAGIKVSVAIQEWTEATDYTSANPKEVEADLQ